MALRATLVIQGRVIYGLILRDIRTRMFGNGLGYIAFSIGWPLIHILFLLVINTALGRITPYGESVVLFFSTGLVPFMTFSYMSRWIMLGIIINKPLLAFPLVTLTDMIFARAFTEVVGSFLMVVTLCTILWFCGVDFVPRDVPQACYAWGAAILLGLGMGIINSIISLAFVSWFLGYTLVIITLYAASGILFVADSLPEYARYPLSFNPVLHAVEWMRSAYYPGYGAQILDKGYILTWGSCTLFGGFLLERLIRGRLLQG